MIKLSSNELNLKLIPIEMSPKAPEAISGYFYVLGVTQNQLKPAL
jgi:hypothetical protein